jgi:cytochrome c oxidase subunit II
MPCLEPNEEPRDELMRRRAAPPWLSTPARAGGLVVMLAILGGCMLPPEPRTTAARDVFNLYAIVLVMGAIVFVGVEGFILYAILRYRRRDDHLPEQLHGNTLIEMVWTAIPTVIVLILFVVSTLTLATVNATSQRPGVRIEVDGFQWQWTFHYLDDDGNPDNDVTVTGTPGQPPSMVVPVNEPVHLVLHSQDVIHAFFVPHFLIKRDVIPVPEGQENQLEFTVTDVGVYSGQCAEFCGLLHAKMTFSVDARQRSDFDAWLADAKAGGTPTPQPSVEPGGTVLKLSANNIAFDTLELEAPAGKPFTIEFTNQEEVEHNVAVLPAGGGTPIFSGERITGPDETIKYQIPALEPGEYQFICEVHPVPSMTGTLTIK